MTSPGTISEARQQLLERFRRGELQTSRTALGPLIPRPPTAEVPLSPDLEQLWLHDRLAGGAPVNNESFTIHKYGPLDPRILERCFNEIVRRHAIWRSAFPMSDGKITQRIEADGRVLLPLVDLSQLPVQEREEEAVRIASEDARRPFDPNVAPLFRVRLVRFTEDYHRIYLTAHRLVFDCASIDHVVMGELAALYTAYSAGQPSPLPELAFQFSDYAAWKHQQSTSANYAAQLEYWRQNLSGHLPCFELSARGPRPAATAWQSEMEGISITAQLTEALREFGTREGVTLYMTLLAAFQVLLCRYCGEDEILIGGKTNTRTRPEFEPLVGSFVNTVVFRSHIAPGLSFREYLRNVKSTVIGALAHSEIPFDDVVRELAPKRDSNRHLLFQVLFSMRAPIPDIAEGWRLTDMEIHSGACCFDLFVEFSEPPQGLMGRFVYSTDLFDRTTIRRLQEDFQVLLQQLIANPDQAISEASLLTGEENNKPLADRNDTTKQRVYVAPSDEIEERLANIWQNLLGVYPVSVTDNYFDLGGHSSLALQLFSEINLCLHLDLPLATLFYAPTIRTMAGIIRDSGIQVASPVVPIQPNGTKPAIFCIGALNGEVILFRRLAMELGQDQPIYGLQPFSLVDRLSTVETLAASYIQELSQRGEHRPFCLLGYSFGGLVALEMARQLRTRGAEPAVVALIDVTYVSGSKATESWSERFRRYRFHLNQIARGAAGIAHLVSRLRSRSFRMIHKVSTTLGVDGPKIASDIVGRQLLAGENYRARPYPGRVYLLKAESRPEFFDSPDLGWANVLSNLQIDEVPGDHGTINTGMNLRILAQKLAAFLKDASLP
ncbi:MAG TPA: condensation domain-containing protein [Bryobacteraceae bacterium]|nr:condensation domain-containing protein [Bryobacteraceae bacterium]